MVDFKNMFGGNSEEQNNDETGFVDELWKNSSLSWSTRIKGFLILFILGCLCSILSSVVLWISFGGGLIAFAILYTIGNILSIGSTCFLMGPCSQLKKMFAQTRIIATIVMLVCILLTLLSALWWNTKGLTLLFIILQFFALLWYSISYIPFARDAVKKVFGSALGV